MTNKELQEILKQHADELNVLVDIRKIEMREIQRVEYHNDAEDINDNSQKFLLIYSR